MAWHRPYRERKYAVGQRLLALRSRARLTQAELAALTGVNRRSVQNWEAGATYPKKEGLEQLIQVFLERGIFEQKREQEEIVDFWEMVRQDAPHPLPVIDPVWLGGLFRERRPIPVTNSDERQALAKVADTPGGFIDWGEAIDVPVLYGRTADLDLLRRWVLDDRCRLIALLGLAGIGKTSLAIAFANQQTPHFNTVIFRSLRNAPPLGEVLDSVLQFQSAWQAAPAETISEKMLTLVRFFREKRCLLILDNFESILQEGLQVGDYRNGYTGYGQLIQYLGETNHQSCLIVTSREKPAEVGLLEGPTAPVRSWTINGLDEHACEIILREKDVFGTPDDCATLARLYGGNPLALKLVCEPIREVFGSDLGAFLLQGELFFNGVGRLLAQEFTRSSPIERHLLYWLAIEREMTSLDTLVQDLSASVSRREVLAGLESLRRRFLIEHSSEQPAFTLQPVILEYITERLVETIRGEIQERTPELLNTHALIQATAKDYVRASQERLVAQTLLDQLAKVLGGKQEIEARLVGMIDDWRNKSQKDQGYGPGNILNLLRLLRGNIRGQSFSGLFIRQAYLQGVEAQDANLSGSHLSDSILPSAFDYGVCVGLSADGALIAAGTASGEVQVWRSAGRIPVLSVQTHSGGIYGIAISPDGKLVASGSMDTTIKLWEVESGKRLATLQGHEGMIHSIAFSADSGRLASASFDGTVRVWSIPDGQPLATLRGHDGIVWGVGLSADGRTAVSGGVDGTVRVWTVDTGVCQAALRGHAGGVWSVALSADGRLAASGGYDGAVRIWQAETGACQAVLSGHTDMVWGVALSADGRLAVSGSNDGTLRIWDTGQSLCLAALAGHHGGIRGAALSADGLTAASTSFDGTIRLWETSTGRNLVSLQGHTGLIWGVAISGDGKYLVSGGMDTRLRLWDADLRQPIANVSWDAGPVNGVAISRDGRTAASGGRDGAVRVWSVVDGRLFAVLQGHAGLVWSVALSADGRYLASGGYDGTVRMWEMERQEPIAILKGHQGPVHCVAITADGRLIASCGMDGTVRVWKPGSSSREVILEGHTGPVWSAALSADGGLIASAGEDGTVRLWETSSEAQRGILEGHTGAVFCAALSGDGTVIASSGMDGTVQVWRVEGLKKLFNMRAHTGAIWGMAMSADGRVIASGGRDGSVELWAAKNGSHLHTLRPERPYERVDISGLTGITEAQRTALLALGAVEQEGS